MGKTEFLLQLAFFPNLIGVLFYFSNFMEATPNLPEFFSNKSVEH